MSAVNWSLGGEKPELQGDKKYHRRSMASSWVTQQKPWPEPSPRTKMYAISEGGEDSGGTLGVLSRDPRRSFRSLPQHPTLGSAMWKRMLDGLPPTSGLSSFHFHPSHWLGPIREYFRTFSHQWAGRVCLSILCTKTKQNKTQQQLCSKFVGQVSLCYHEDRLGERRQEGS